MIEIIPHRKVIIDSGLAYDIITAYGCVFSSDSITTSGESFYVFWNWWIMN